MEQFPHLKFVQKLTGIPRFFGGGSANNVSNANRENRTAHSSKLGNSTSKIRQDWIKSAENRDAEGLAPLDVEIIPIFFRINPELVNSDFDLQSFGIEIISEEDDGFIIGASVDALKSLEEKIQGFSREEHGTGLIADMWEIIAGNREAWKPEHILSESLFNNWPLIEDDKVYQLEVSIAFDRPLGKEPDPTKRGGEKRLERYKKDLIDRDDKLLERENHFEKFVGNYGRIISDLVHLEDSFSCEVEISGKGLKDLVFNYPFVFEVSEMDEVEGVVGSDENGLEYELEILAPDDNDPEIGVIDSGIMEDNKYISAAIKRGNSKCYIDGETSKADKVKGGGHGTKVAGAVLYPNGISNVTSPYKLPCFIRNLKILNDDNQLTTKFPAALMKQIADENEECKIFNLSVTSKAPFRKKHMSSWAATIDSIVHGKDVLFIVSAGNLYFDSVRHYIRNGQPYPRYLQNGYAQLANPAQSSFALTVGSINSVHYEDANWISLGEENEISAFSRVGLGIWDKIKPDVVEFGGGLIMSKNGAGQVRYNESTCPELVRSTYHGGNAYGKDGVGTSFSAPKIAHIAALLKKLYPEENINLLRALLVQGARLPANHFINPTKNSLRYFGYGLPSLERVTRNSNQRISFYSTGEIRAEEGHIYSLKLPENLFSPGDEYDILLEVTLAYTAKVRRTRQKTRSYLSTWLDWTSSKIDEKFDQYKEYVLKEIENSATTYDKEKRKKLNSYQWKIGERSDWGQVDDINRNNSTVQKDWTILKSYELPNEINFAVRGHRGWDKNMEEVPYALVVSLEILNVNVPIYEQIRIENGIEIPV